MDMETELGETWGRVGDIEVLEACFEGCLGVYPTGAVG